MDPTSGALHGRSGIVDSIKGIGQLKITRQISAFGPITTSF